MRPATSSTAASGRPWCTVTSAAGRRAVDLAAERLLAEVLVAGSRDGMISAAHDLSEGGLAQALVEMCVGRADRCADRAARGAPIRSCGCSRNRPRAWWLPCRAPRSCGSPRCARCAKQPWVKIGVVDAGDTGALDEQALDIQDVARLQLRDLQAAWEGTLPALFG